jgi:xanthine dehydrogenase small subunit
MIRFILNNTPVNTSQPPGMVLLDFIRYHRGLTGTKIGCREGDCGACTVLVGRLKDEKIYYESMTSCLLPIGNIDGKHIVTIEGINMEKLNPVQQAMAEEGATQCGFCSPGFVMSLAGFCLGSNPHTHENAIAAIDGNICRCTGYKSIERAALKISAIMQQKKKQETTVAFLSSRHFIPAYFNEIPARLEQLHASDNNLQLPGCETKEKIKVVGGGTDLYVQQHDEMVHADIEFIPVKGQKRIRPDGNDCVIEAAVTVTDLQRSSLIQEIFPAFHSYAKLISSTPIRNMATIAGNFINASPIGDFTVFFLALDAQIELADGINKRMLPLCKLYKGYKTLDKKPHEHIITIRFEMPGTKTLFHFEKVSKRRNLDIASVNSAICLETENDIIAQARIAAGGVAPVPMLLQKTAAFLEGKKISRETVEEAVEVMKTEISPISDARGSGTYKTILLGQLIKAHFITLFPAAYQ